MEKLEEDAAADEGAEAERDIDGPPADPRAEQGRDQGAQRGPDGDRKKAIGLHARMASAGHLVGPERDPKDDAPCDYQGDRRYEDPQQGGSKQSWSENFPHGLGRTLGLYGMLPPLG